MATACLGAGDKIEMHNPGRVCGAGGTEQVLIQSGAHDVKISSAVDVLHFGLASGQYSFAGSKGLIHVWQADTLLASLVVGKNQALRFADGSISVGVNAENGQVLLGGTALSTSPAACSGFVNPASPSDNGNLDTGFDLPGRANDDGAFGARPAGVDAPADGSLVWLSKDDTGGVHGSGRVYGARGVECVLLHDDARDARISSSVEQVHLEFVAGAFAGASGTLEIWRNGVRQASLVVGGGQDVRFADGAANVSLDPETDAVILGGAVLWETPAASEIFLDASEALEISRIPFHAPVADSCEPNDGIATATALSAFGARANLSIHLASDHDCFKISLNGEGTPDTFVQIDFAHEAGNLDLDILNACGAVVRESLGVTDGERISLNALPAGDCYAHVSGVDGATNTYPLTWNADTTAPAFSEFSPGDGRTARIMGISGLTLQDFSPLSDGSGLRCERGDITDAEKTESSSRDDAMCWGAVAANMLADTVWGAAGLASLRFFGPCDAVEDNVFLHVRENHRPGAGTPYNDGIRWFASHAGLTFSAGTAGNLFDSPTLNPAFIAGHLLDGDSMGILVYGAVRHALTCQGFVYDASNPDVSDPSRCSAQILADSDNDRLNTDPGSAPNSLVIVDCSQDGGGVWHLDNYLPNQALEGKNLRIVEADFLGQYA